MPTWKYVEGFGPLPEHRGMGGDPPKFPLIRIMFYHPTRQTLVEGPLEGLLDTGSQDVLIQYPVAAALTLDQIEETDVNVGGDSGTGWKTEVHLKIGRGRRAHDFGIIDATIAPDISPKEGKLLTPTLIGRRPIFEECDVTFVRDHKVILIIP